MTRVTCSMLELSVVRTRIGVGEYMHMAAEGGIACSFFHCNSA